MIKGIIIERNNIAGISYPMDPNKEGAHPRVVLRNGEVLDLYLTLEFRNFDFSGRMFSFYDIGNNEIFNPSKQCVFLELEKIKESVTHIIENIIITDKGILEKLLS